MQRNNATVKIFGAVIMTAAIEKVLLLPLINTYSPTVPDGQSKPTNLGCESTYRLQSSTFIIAVCYYKRVCTSAMK